MDPLTQKEPKGVSCLLGIETSADLCSVAIGRNQSLLFKKSIHMPYGQAGHLLGLIQENLREAHLTWQDIKGIVINRGPGSFTGIRVGLATAHGLAIAGNIPLWGLTGFDAYRCLSDIHQNLFVLIDTRRDDYFVAFFERGHLHQKFVSIMTRQDVQDFCASHQENIVLTGNVDLSFFAAGETSTHALEADDIIQAYYFYHEKNKQIFSSDPYYLREPEIHDAHKPL